MVLSWLFDLDLISLWNYFDFVFASDFNSVLCMCFGSFFLKSTPWSHFVILIGSMFGVYCIRILFYLILCLSWLGCLCRCLILRWHYGKLDSLFDFYCLQWAGLPLKKSCWYILFHFTVGLLLLCLLPFILCFVVCFLLRSNCLLLYFDAMLDFVWSLNCFCVFFSFQVDLTVFLPFPNLVYPLLC